MLGTLACQQGATLPTDVSTAQSVNCMIGEVYLGSAPITDRLRARAWLEANRTEVARRAPKDCAARAIAFVEETNFARWQLLISSGYSASEPGNTFRDDGRQVTLFNGRVCGGAYPSSQLTLLRLPRNRAIRFETQGGKCESNVP
jgi:hypothetical protein